MKLFNKSIKNMNLKQKFNYIKNHYTYYTMNRWNRLQTIANNVKIYKLGFTNEQQQKFFDIYGNEDLCGQLYDIIDQMIIAFEEENNYCKIYFNGRSNGYLIMKNNYDNGNILPQEIENANTYNELIADIGRSNANSITNEYFKIVCDFDNLCDEILEELKNILDNSIIETEETQVIKTTKYLTIK